MRTFRLTTHTTGVINAGEPHSHSHWTIYLVHNNTSTRLSMRIDQRHEIEYPQGKLVISDVNYTTPSNSAVRFWDFPAVPNITVQDVLRVILSHRRQEYNMGENGRGCRFWMWVHSKMDTEISVLMP